MSNAMVALFVSPGEFGAGLLLALAFGIAVLVFHGLIKLYKGLVEFFKAIPNRGPRETEDT